MNSIIHQLTYDIKDSWH